MKDSLHIDFTEWAELATSDPEAFEEKREEAVESFIRSVPTETRRRRLRQLQWQIDGIRRRSKSPMGACMKITSLMWDSVYGEGGLLDTLQGNISFEKQTVAVCDTVSASNIIPFRAR
ncbi:MAG: DUF3135 domain-containing protein [Gammaproteobacteria bacterium]|nr:DUF3135 domain-containing protein [Gammaproteobacteria bacterium]MDH5594690.1 DUF3135 domain-containing protein [Gammaproteobacteria bacterium]MDH5614495.1 DUF3135 domain-containing protein [Gammaproteobacteria bacterium]